MALVPGSRSKFGNWTTVPSLYSWNVAECDVKPQPNQTILQRYIHHFISECVITVGSGSISYCDHIEHLTIRQLYLYGWFPEIQCLSLSSMCNIKWCLLCSSFITLQASDLHLSIQNNPRGYCNLVSDLGFVLQIDRSSFETYLLPTYERFP